ncbi:MAG: hypothetical protein LBH30_00035 [Prevotellaceae bacterium]|jgi:hypothetical protein|nr:hypothetical protein [Prevotellaceae bacterium]
MKKIFYLAFALLALSFTLTSCSKDDEAVTPDSLTDTTWVTTLTDEDGSVTITLKFITNSEFIQITSAVGEEDEEVGVYTYNKPTVRLIFDGENEVTGKVSGNKMTFTEQGVVFKEK